MLVCIGLAMDIGSGPGTGNPITDSESLSANKQLRAINRRSVVEYIESTYLEVVGCAVWWDD